MASRGLADLSPPEAMHAVLELPTHRADYVGVLQDMGDYPRRSPIGARVPDPAEVAALSRLPGRWRAVVLLEDERAVRAAAAVFGRVFVLDPYYDCGALLYAAWHDPAIRDEHARSLAEQARCLVRAGPLFRAGTAVLAPDHLPGSWNPRPGWRKPRSTDDARLLAAWSMRCSLVLLYWADRLGAVVCAARDDVVAGLDVALGPACLTTPVVVAEPPRIDACQASRAVLSDVLEPRWAALHRLSRARGGRCLEAVAAALGGIADCFAPDLGGRAAWRLLLGEPSLPDPSLLLRRVLAGEDPWRDPPLPPAALRRRPLCLVPAPAPSGGD